MLCFVFEGGMTACIYIQKMRFEVCGCSCAGLRRGRRVHGNASRYQLDANLQKIESSSTPLI